jgi:integrin-linked kinase-associated serine/threonine phosphatase 2C
LLPSLLLVDFFPLKGYFAERKGERDEMQDAHTIIEDFASSLSNLHSSV